MNWKRWVIQMAAAATGMGAVSVMSGEDCNCLPTRPVSPQPRLPQPSLVTRLPDDWPRQWEFRDPGTLNAAGESRSTGPAPTESIAAAPVKPVEPRITRPSDAQTAATGSAADSGRYRDPFSGLFVSTAPSLGDPFGSEQSDGKLDQSSSTNQAGVTSSSKQTDRQAAADGESDPATTSAGSSGRNQSLPWSILPSDPRYSGGSGGPGGAAIGSGLSATGGGSGGGSSNAGIGGGVSGGGGGSGTSAAGSGGNQPWAPRDSSSGGGGGGGGGSNSGQIASSQSSPATDPGDISENDPLLFRPDPPPEEIPCPVPELPDGDETTVVVGPPPGGGDSNTPIVPEPGSLLLLTIGSALGGCAWRKRRMLAASESRPNEMIAGT